MNPKGIIVHHSLTEDGKVVDWQAIRRYHVEVNGWKDIGYHAGVELVGARYEILLGRMEDEPGAHCLGFNDDYLGLMLCGNFDQVGPPVEQIQLALKWCRSKMNLYGIKHEDVLGHWETYEKRGLAPQKTCPGVMIKMMDFRAAL